MLAFGRKQRLQPQVLDMNTLIGGLEPMLRQLIAAHIELTVSLTADAALVKMDPTQLEQVLVNLALNAADAMPRGGTLTIQTTSESLAEQFERRQVPAPPGSFLLLAVTDTGQGIDEATRRHMFEPFFTTKAVGKGATRPAILALYMSGYADEAVRDVLSIEGRPFLPKPFTPQALSQKVRAALDGGTTASSRLSHVP